MLAGTCTAILLGSCSDLFVTPAPPAPAELGVSFALAGGSPTAGGTDDAFAKANRLRLRLARSESVLLDTLLALQVGEEEETRVRLSVQPDRNEESVNLLVELLLDADPLFRGNAELVLRAGGVAEVPIQLAPVPAGIVPSPTAATLTSLGETVQLTGAVVFATGDTITGATVAWSSANANIASVSDVGVVTANSSGETVITATHGAVSADVDITVRQEAASIEFVPESVTVRVGETLALEPTVRDAAENPIVGAVVDTWVSSVPQVASVDGVGRVTGLAAGSTVVTASIGEISGSVTVAVIAPPIVATDTVNDVAASSATLTGTVDPLGTPTEAWFEYGLTETALGTATPARSVGSGDGDQPFSEAIAGLNEGTTYFYRLSARNAAGTTNGAVRSFQTPVVILTPGTPVLSATSESALAVLEWEPTGPDANLYRVERRVGALGSWTEAGVVTNGGSPPPTRFQESPGGGRFDYRVQACFDTDCSPFSNVASVELPPTPPTVETRATTGIGSNTAVFNGYLMPNGSETWWWFEISASTDFSMAEFCNPPGEESAGTDSDWVISCEPSWGLAGGSTYWVRLVAENDVGQTEGEALSFTTQAAQPPTIVTEEAVADIYWVDFRASGSGNGAPVRVWVEFAFNSEFIDFQSTGFETVSTFQREFDLLFPEVEVGIGTVYYRAAGDNGVGGVIRGAVRSIELEESASIPLPLGSLAVLSPLRAQADSGGGSTAPVPSGAPERPAAGRAQIGPSPASR